MASRKDNCHRIEDSTENVDCKSSTRSVVCDLGWHNALGFSDITCYLALFPKYLLPFDYSTYTLLNDARREVENSEGKHRGAKQKSDREQAS